MWRDGVLAFLLAGAAGAWAQPAASINSGGIVNAASSAAVLAAGSIVSIYGSFLISAPAQALGVPLPDSLAGLSVAFGGIDAPLYYVSSGQINAQVPWEMAGQSSA